MVDVALALDSKQRQGCFKVICCLTNLLILWDTHDLKGLHGLCKEVLVLLPRNCDVSIWKEAVVVVIFKEEFIWEKRINQSEINRNQELQIFTGSTSVRLQNKIQKIITTHQSVFNQRAMQYVAYCAVYPQPLWACSRRHERSSHLWPAEWHGISPTGLVINLSRTSFLVLLWLYTLVCSEILTHSLTCLQIKGATNDHASIVFGRYAMLKVLIGGLYRAWSAKHTRQISLTHAVQCVHEDCVSRPFVTEGINVLVPVS